MKSGARWAAATSLAGWAHSHVQPLAHITGSMNIPLASTQHGEQTCLLSIHQNLPASREDRAVNVQLGSGLNRRGRLLSAEEQAVIRRHQTQQWKTKRSSG